MFFIAIGYLSSIAHKSAKLLLSFTAKNSLSGKKLGVSLKIHILANAERLHVRKKYGINYGSKSI